jgi:caffeoyl-CoA O-methyltransferase
MKSLVLEGLEEYCRAHTTAMHPLYERLRDETYAKVALPQMQVGHLEGRLLRLLTQLTGARLAVEVGTFTGYSGLAIAEGLSEGGHLHTFDIDPNATGIALRYWAEAPWAKDRITLHLGDARALLGAFLTRSAPVDFAFVDADKVGYVDYWEALVPAMRPGGVIAVDNVLWSGRVLSPSHPDDHAIVAFNRHAAADARMETVMLTVRDGVLLARKR